jgi:hypothetical protein
MKNQFITEGVWKSLTAAANAARKPALVAVAYFGQGASKLLPLPPASWLVVDASDDVVKKGLTHPADLKLLQKRGVVIFSSLSLHAKVYAFDGFAFIGSPNVSNGSAGRLTEAVVKTYDQAVFRNAKAFVKGLCLDEITPGRLDQLQKIYRPPRLPGGGAPKSTKRKSQRELPRLRLAQLKPGDSPEGSEEAEEKGLAVGESRRKQKRGYTVDKFWWTGKCPFKERDKVIQVTEYPDGKRLIDAPADVINTHVWRRNGREVTFVYLELPEVRRVSLDVLARRLGYGAKKKLHKSGIVGDPAFEAKLLGNWSQF